MSYDCTLHIVDPRSIERFAEHFLGRLRGETRFDAEYDVPKLYAKVHEAIAHDSERGGRLLLQALLFFVSTETPHLYSRNFALGLWDRFVDEQIPLELQKGDALAEPLRPILEAHPELKGRLWSGFVGNFEVGHYVPPDKVPALLDFVTEEVRHVKPSQQDLFEPLLRVLRLAKEKGFGYWEATDLDVAQANESWLRPPKGKPAPPTLETVSVPLELASLIVSVGDRLLLSSVSTRGSSFVDTATNPPTVINCLGPAPHEGPSVFKAGASTEGRVVGVVAMEPRSPRILAEIDLEAGELRPLPPPPAGAFDRLRFVNDRLLLAPDAYGGAQGKPPAWYDEGELKPLELPTPPEGWEKERVQTSTGFTSGWSGGVFDAHGFGEDLALVIWGGWLYRVEGSKGTLLPPRDLRGPSSAMNPPIADGESGVLWIDHSSLVRLNLDGEREVVSSALDEITELCRGPGQAIVIKQEDNLEGDVIKVIWRGTREVTRVPPDLLGEKEPPRAIAYVPTREALALLYFGESKETLLRFLLWADIEAFPRCSFADIAAERESIRAAAAARKLKKIVEKIEGATSAIKVKDVTFPAKDMVVEDPKLGWGVITYADLLGRFTVTFRDGQQRDYEKPKKRKGR